MYQKIEHLIGKKLDQFQAEQEAVLMMLERVNEAQRMATMQVRPSARPARLCPCDGGMGPAGLPIVSRGISRLACY